MTEVAADLAGPSPSLGRPSGCSPRSPPCSWFALRLHEANYASGSTSQKGGTIAQSEHGQRRIDRAHRRLMMTLKTLATVRRLAVPSIQVNVANQQVNVAGSA